MHIDSDSYGTLLVVYLAGLVVVTASILLIPNPWILWPLVAFALVFCLWQTFFFRVPHRKPVGSAHLVSSVADGKVVLIKNAFEEEYLKRECLQVSVYMDFFDVHANFWPIDGKVTYYSYHPGKHLLAFSSKASENNEHTSTSMINAEGKELLFRQLAGTFARRIVNYSTVGLETRSGHQCGIIKFGSRIDMFLPLDADIKVKVGDYVRAVETIIATI